MAVDLDERGRELLSAGLAESGGPARPTNALALALGFTDVTRAVIRFALLSLVLVAATGCSGRGNELHLGGPLACAQCGRLAVSMPLDVGKPLTHGTVLLKNHGATSARITAVHLDRRRGPLQVLAILASPVGHKGLIAIMPGFLPRGWVLPNARRAIGYVIQPGRYAELLIGVRLNRAGVAGYHSITLDYVAGRTRYRATYNDPMRACSPLKSYAYNCNTPPAD